MGMTSPCLSELSVQCAAGFSEIPSRFGQFIRKSSCTVRQPCPGNRKRGDVTSATYLVLETSTNTHVTRCGRHPRWRTVGSFSTTGACRTPRRMRRSGGVGCPAGNRRQIGLKISHRLVLGLSRGPRGYRRIITRRQPGGVPSPTKTRIVPRDAGCLMPDSPSRASHVLQVRYEKSGRAGDFVTCSSWACASALFRGRRTPPSAFGPPRPQVSLRLAMH